MRSLTQKKTTAVDMWRGKLTWLWYVFVISLKRISSSTATCLSPVIPAFSVRNHGYGIPLQSLSRTNWCGWWSKPVGKGKNLMSITHATTSTELEMSASSKKKKQKQNQKKKKFSSSFSGKSSSPSSFNVFTEVTEEQKTQVFVPPWLSNVAQQNSRRDSHRKHKQNANNENNHDDNTQRTYNPSQASSVAESFQLLRIALQTHHHYHYSATHTQAQEYQSKFSDADIQEILKAIPLAARGDLAKMKGTCEFLCLLLSVEEHNQVTPDVRIGSYAYSDLDADLDLDADVEVVWDSGDTQAQAKPKPQAPTSPRGLHVTIMTRDTLIASAFHYCDCVRARESGMYESQLWKHSADNNASPAQAALAAPTAITSTSLRASSTQQQSASGLGLFSEKYPYSYPASSSSLVPMRQIQQQRLMLNSPRNSNHNYQQHSSQSSTTTARLLLDNYGDNVARIAHGAAQLKRAELLADSILFHPNYSPFNSYHTQVHNKNHSATSTSIERRATAFSQGEEAEALRGLLLNVMTDWRSLAIRATACLYRLRGIQSSLLLTLANDEQLSPSTPSSSLLFSSVMATTPLERRRTPEMHRVAREALSIYAPLAQRLGMQRLKVQLEAAAFQVLYPRQFRIANLLYKQVGGANDARNDAEAVTEKRKNNIRHVQGEEEDEKDAIFPPNQQHTRDLWSLAQYLTTQIEQTLLQDKKLMSHLDHIAVTSRVKEPYSLWKKLLKKRTRRQRKLQNENKQEHFLLPPAASSQEDKSMSSTIESKSIQKVEPQQPQARKSWLSLTHVPDTIALRIILRAEKHDQNEDGVAVASRERWLCYYVQHLLMKTWPPFFEEGRSCMKDYIQHPKENGYQSLHYTSRVWLGGDPMDVSHGMDDTERYDEFGQDDDENWFPFEVQIRSEAMHYVAEYGVAAHWDYKLEDTKTTENEDRKPSQWLLQGSTLSTSSPLKANDHDVDTEEETTSNFSNPPEQKQSLEHREKHKHREQDMDIANQANQGSVASHIHSLLRAQTNQLQRSVYVFIAPSSCAADGTLVSLPTGVCILEVSLLWTQLFDEEQQEKLLRMAGAGTDDMDTSQSCKDRDEVLPFLFLLNGKRVQGMEVLQNGDVLSLPADASCFGLDSHYPLSE